MFSRFRSNWERSQNKPEELEAQVAAANEPDRENDGLFMLNDAAQDTDYNVDIVAIHGLGGDWQGTWTDKNDTLWLRDFLPRDVPKARLFSYGYNSQTAFSKSVADISDVANRLLSHLNGERQGATKRRPIIFISHSLGGIIVKKALVIAHERSSIYGDLLGSVRGSVFFGVPHRGSDAAYWGLFAGNLLKYGQLGFGTNTNFVEALKRNSHEFDDISNQFIERGAKLAIRTFYETEKMGNQLIVDRDSACLRLANEIAVGIAANHRTMCKFESAGSQKYIPVRNAVTELVALAVVVPVVVPPVSYVSSAEELACLQCLYTSDYQSHKERNPSRVSGTCGWFLNHPKYLTWKESEQSSLLWLSADPGCGKSVLSSFLVDELKDELKSTLTSATSTVAVCYFFFKDDSEAQRRAPNALSAILHQLCAASPQLIKHPLAEYRKKSEKFVTEVATLWKLIVLATAQEDCGPVLCILDGLDECEEGSRLLLLNALVGFYSVQPREQAQRKARQLKFLVTSRPYSIIEQRFHKIPTVRLKAEEETASVSKDIERVIRARVREIGDFRDHLDHSQQEELSERLIQSADRTFLWISLILRMIEQSARLSQSALKRMITQIPSSLDAIYEKILAQSTDVVSAIKLLHIIVAAVEPMSPQQVNFALHVEQHQQSYADLQRDLEPDIETTIKDLGGLFVRVIDERVYLVHQTAKEFLLKSAAKEPMDSKRWKHSINIYQANAILASSCIKYMLQLHQHALDESVDENKREKSEQSARFKITEAMSRELSFDDFLRYACAHWRRHIIDSDSESNDPLCRSALLLCDTRSRAYATCTAVSPRLFRSWDLVDTDFVIRTYEALGLEETSLATAAALGLKSLVTHLTKNISHYTTEHLGAALIMTIWGGHLDVAKILVEQRRECLQFPDKHGKTSLGHAILKRNNQWIQLFIDGGAPLDSACWTHDTTPLHLAVANGQGEIVKTLLHHGAAVDAVDCFGMTALMMIDRRSTEEMLMLLLGANANLEHRDHAGQTPFIYYLEDFTKPNSKVMLGLLEKGASTKDINGRRLAKTLGLSLMKKTWTDRGDRSDLNTDPFFKILQLLHRSVGSPLLRYGVEDDQASSVGYGRAGDLFNKLYAHAKLHGYKLNQPIPEPGDPERRLDSQAWIDVLRLMRQMDILTVALPGRWRWKTRDELLTHQVLELNAEDAKPLLGQLGELYSPANFGMMRLES